GLDLAPASSYMSAMALPKMVRVRQRFSRPVVSDIPAATRATLGACGHPIRGGDVVAIGTSSRGIANYATIVKATVDHLRELGAKPFIFPAMGSHGGGTPEGQLSVLDHYGISEKTMGVPCRATMEVVQVGDALGLPVWLEKGAAGADWVCLVNRVKPHTDFKGSIESGLFKMMTIGLGKYKGAIQYHRANVRHSYETVIGRPSNPHEPFPNDPRILWVVALDLTDNTYGNATGIGNADFTTRKLVEKIDMKATLINCLAACSPGGAKLPPAFDSDREAIEAALSCTGLLVPEREARVVRIKNTLMLGEIEVSESLLPEIAKRGTLTILGEPAEL